MIHQKNTLNRAKENIQKGFPHFEVKSISFVGEGMDSQAFVVNDEFIFRFPKHEEVVSQLKAEISLLPKLSSYVHLKIPDFKYVGQQQENGFPFVGYKKIQGVGLAKGIIRKFNTDLQNKLIKEMADFLQQVRSFPVDIAKKSGVKVADFRKNYTSDLENMRKKAYHLLDRDVINYVEKLLTYYLTDKQNFSYTPVLLHADFSPDHIIFNDNKKDIVGVIDFGDIEIGDPDYDLMYLYEDYWEEAFIRELLKYYPHNNPERLMKKLDFFSRCDTIHGVLLGLYRKDDGILQLALKELREEVKEQLTVGFPRLASE
jgi:aminoglycoside 2''-phosphotransferase